MKNGNSINTIENQSNNKNRKDSITKEVSNNNSFSSSSLTEKDDTHNKPQNQLKDIKSSQATSILTTNNNKFDNSSINNNNKNSNILTKNNNNKTNNNVNSFSELYIAPSKFIMNEQNKDLIKNYEASTSSNLYKNNNISLKPKGKPKMSKFMQLYSQNVSLNSCKASEKSLNFNERNYSNQTLEEAINNQQKQPSPRTK